jgi:hypothetical protein
MPNDGVLSKMPLSERAKEMYLKWSKGSSLKKQVKIRWRIGWRGDTNTGKSHKALTMLTDVIITQAEDDEYIKDFFSFNPKLKVEVLESSIEQRRKYLLDAHMVVFMDFDNGGLQPLIDADVCKEELLDCLQYINIGSWPEAVGAKDMAIEMLHEHEKKWGPNGCWIIIDNATKAWSYCQSDFIKSVTGVGMNELMADIKMANPGQTSEARRQQAKELSEIKDYTVISPSHNDEWLDQMLNTGYHIMMMSPNKTRITEVREGDVTFKREYLTLGGHPNNPYQMDYIIRLHKSDDGQTFFANIDKARHLGPVSETLANPTFTDIRELIQEKREEYTAEQQVKHNNTIISDTRTKDPEIIDPKAVITNFPQVDEIIDEPINLPSDDFELPDDEPEEDVPDIVIIDPNNFPNPEGDRHPATYEITDEFLKKAKKSELKEACDQYGESTEGKKADLIERLKHHHTDQKKVYDSEKCGNCEKPLVNGNCEECNPQDDEEDLPEIDLDGW